MGKHSPAPWAVGKFGTVFDCNGNPVAGVENKADSPLIAAAPAMLEALTALIEFDKDLCEKISAKWVSKYPEGLEKVVELAKVAIRAATVEERG
jgi:hypothetical protein